MDEKREPALKRALQFFRHGIWQAQARELSRPRKALLLCARMAMQTAHGFSRDRCPMHAASLTYFTLMALIPVLALTLAVARAFGGGELAKEQINRRLDSWMEQVAAPKPQPQARRRLQHADSGSPGEGSRAQAAGPQSASAAAEAAATDAQPPQSASAAAGAAAFAGQVREIANKLMEQVDHISFGTLGGIGAVMLFWTVISMLGKVETSFNEIWDVKKPRTTLRKISDYLCTIMILPFLMTAASTIPVAARIKKIMDQAVGGGASTAVRTLLDSGFFKAAATLALSSLTFAFLIGFMPNVKVKTWPALAGGFVTALLFSGWLRLCAMLQIGIAKYSALYGGFAVLPILLMWVYTSWEIILMGSEIAFAVQTRGACMLDEAASRASMRSRFLLALAFCAEAARRARQPDGGPLSAEEFARERGIPLRLVLRLLDDLSRENVAAEVADRPGSYLLCRCGESITVADLFFRLFGDGTPPESLGLQRLGPDAWTVNQALGKAIYANFSLPIAELAQAGAAE